MIENHLIDYPLVSCIMPTYNRRRFVGQAIQYFLEQDYPDKELIIVDDGTDRILDLVPSDSQIKFIELPLKKTIGEKRNLAIEQSRADIILHWDDDDWQARHRIRYQVTELLKNNAEICGNDRMLFYDLNTGNLWIYKYPPQQRKWLAGETLCYTKGFWKERKFDHTDVGEDNRFVWKKHTDRLLTLSEHEYCVAMVHGQNVSPKSFKGHHWSQQANVNIKSILGVDWIFYNKFNSNQKPQQNKALLAAASGIGDILRITPLIRILDQLGYSVDVLLSPDFAETVSLLKGAKEIANLFVIKKQSFSFIEKLQRKQYDMAVFTKWALPFKNKVKAKGKIEFEHQQWLKSGESACVETVAKTLGWDKPIPRPFAITSNRKFDLEPGTIALHPGCKPDWPWKKWHGFDELANMLQNVVIIGKQSDLDNDKTYFKRAFNWPDHAKIYIDSLNLADTAALISQCSALVANDSGIMQLGATLGIPTFGIFGITNPSREIMFLENMIPISNELSCQNNCRNLPWGSRNCRFGFECLKTLTAEKVKAFLDEKLQSSHIIKRKKKETQKIDQMKLKFYGHIFDSTGYGNASRGYIHALNAAGVSLSVVNLSDNGKQVNDPLVESLLNKPLRPDFHLFHGIPWGWNGHLSNLSQTIAMTVWETDTMPPTWQRILNRVREVWLPCDFNVAAFKPKLKVPLFKLPHVLNLNGNNDNYEPSNQLKNIKEDVFVFYSIFEWQDRKNPLGLMTAYLNAIKNNNGTVLFIKTNLNAARVAFDDLKRIRVKTGSKAAVEICCEAWSEKQIDAMHQRGDCYISLHRGEGWGLPAFIAASKGKPIIATDYSGPKEYLDPNYHSLIRYKLTPVRQAYQFYHPKMQWAEPDPEHASESIDWVNKHRDQAIIKAQIAAEQIKNNYAAEVVGKKAKDHLLELLDDNSISIKSSPKIISSGYEPPLPIPGDWYDKDYFENGKKSNWKSGYNWSSFAGLFRNTADFLCNTFVNVESFLEVGCAKGFLIKTLQERKKTVCGFDHSAWAVNHALPAVKPFITCASVDDVNYKYKFDMLLAFETFSHLSETQVYSFLRRARNWIKVGLFATIPVIESEDEIRKFKKTDNDPSHILLKPQKWWHDLFLRAGWKQDALHRIIQNICQENQLTKNMNWNVFVYSVGK